VTARLNVPWSDVLDAIERSTTQKVALLALEPDARTGSVALTAEARSLDDLLSYVEGLGQDAAVASVRMGQHDLRAQDPGHPVRMTLSLSIGPVPLRQ
jgi:Tfp pilus assembly protein PilN